MGAKPATAGSDTVGAAIAYGYRANNTDFPYIATLLDGNNYWAGCSGTLVRPRLVITAAHCTAGETGGTPKYVKSVIVGLVDWQTDTPAQYEIIKVQKIVRHPYYNPDTTSNDIALLVLEKPAKTKPAQIAPADLRLVPNVPNSRTRGDYLYVAGWGKTQSGNPSPHLMYAYVPFISRAQCNKIFQGYFGGSGTEVPASHLCAGFGSNWQDACAGDSGGPIVKETNTGDVLVGIVSFGPAIPCGSGPSIGAYTSIMVMRGFINTQIRNLRL